jgi:hypothetical protein
LHGVRGKLLLLLRIVVVIGLGIDRGKILRGRAAMTIDRREDRIRAG